MLYKIAKPTQFLCIYRPNTHASDACLCACAQVIMFGFVAMFSVAFPFAPLLAALSVMMPFFDPSKCNLDSRVKISATTLNWRQNKFSSLTHLLTCSLTLYLFYLLTGSCLSRCERTSWSMGRSCKEWSPNPRPASGWMDACSSLHKWELSHTRWLAYLYPGLAKYDRICFPVLGEYENAGVAPFSIAPLVVACPDTSAKTHHSTCKWVYRIRPKHAHSPVFAIPSCVSRWRSIVCFLSKYPTGWKYSHTGFERTWPGWSVYGCVMRCMCLVVLLVGL